MGHHRFIAGPREGLRHRSGFVRAIVLVILAACLANVPRSVSADANETPVNNANASSQASITAGDNHTCALLSGVLTCWGLNGHGQLGNGTTTDRSEPTYVTGLTSGVTAITAGAQHTCAVHSGAAKCWGRGSEGQLGDGTSIQRNTPVTVSGLDGGVTAIAAGGFHTCALKSGGVWCWGYNTKGQLGNGNTTNSSIPVQVSGLTSGVIAITAGDQHTCALLDSGAARCWGLGTSGRLGNGDTADSSTPVQVSGLTSGVTAITAGENHTCALLSSGAVNCWGGNGNGQLGNGNITSSSTPVTVSGLDGGVTAAAVAAGGYHTCAKVGQTAMCWGGGSSGQLGTSNTVNTSTPTQVSGDFSGVTAITAGGWHTCALQSSAVTCWGKNQNGQLGDNTIVDKTTPTPISARVLMTITYNANGGTTPTGGDQTTYRFAAINSLAETTRTGYAFVGWYSATDGVKFNVNQQHNETTNFTLNAQWTANTLTITYDINYVGGTNPTPGTTTTGDNYPSLPTPTRTGFEFTGWYVAASGGTPVTAGTAHGRTSDFTLFAQWVEKLTITYNINYVGGTNPTPGTTTTGGTYPNPLPTPTRTGYTFNGWTRSGSPVTAGTAHGETSNFTLDAQWTADTLTITYNINYVGGTNPTPGTTTTGGNYPTFPTDPTRTGYTFNGWYTASSGGTKITAGTAHGQTSNFTLYAQWTINYYTVSFNKNGGDRDQFPQSWYYGYAAPSANCYLNARTGYTLAGWNSSFDNQTYGASCSNGAGRTLSGFTVPASNVVLTAVWTANTLTITYDINYVGGTSPSSGTTTTGGTITSLPTPPTRNGYVFAGWNTAPDGNGLDVGTIVAPNSDGPFHGQTSDFTLFAQWTGLPLNIAYDANGGTITATGSATTTVGGTITSLPTTTLAGFTFVGWFTASSGGTQVTANTAHGQTSDFTLFAQWSLVPVYALTYDANNGNGNPPSGATAATGATLIVASGGTLSRAGYTFAGWNTQADGTGSPYSVADIFTMGASHVTLFAQWTADTLTITYDANGGTITVTGSATTITGGTITSLPTTTRTGYTFAGWFTASSGGTQVTTSAAHGQTSNFTLHAQWNLAPVVQPVPPTLAPPVIAPAPPAALPSTITITMSDQSGVTFQHQQERIATGLSMSPGGRMSVVGAHYQSGSTVEIWINSTRVHLGTANVGRDNTFDLTTTLPIDIEPGVHTLEIIGIDIAGNSQTTFIAVTILEPGNIDEPIFELPVTGHDSDLLTNWSLALLVAGILVGVLSRRRGLLR